MWHEIRFGIIGKLPFETQEILYFLTFQLLSSKNDASKGLPKLIIVSMTCTIQFMNHISLGKLDMDKSLLT